MLVSRICLFFVAFILSVSAFAAPQPVTISAPERVKIGQRFDISFQAQVLYQGYYQVYENGSKISAFDNSVDRMLVDGTYATINTRSRNILKWQPGNYSYKIRACSQGTCGDFGNEVTVIVDDLAPGPKAQDDAFVLPKGTSQILPVGDNDYSLHGYSVSLNEILTNPLFGSAELVWENGVKLLKYSNTGGICNADGYFEDELTYNIRDITQKSSEPAQVKLKIYCYSADLPQPASFYFNAGFEMEAGLGARAYLNKQANASRYELFENGEKVVEGENSYLDFQPATVGKHHYATRACNLLGCGPLGEQQLRSVWPLNAETGLTNEHITLSMRARDNKRFTVDSEITNPQGLPITIDLVEPRAQYGNTNTRDNDSRFEYLALTGVCADYNYYKDSIGYRVTYSNHQISATRKITMKVYCDENDLPLAENDLQAYSRNQAIDIDVLQNDVEPKGLSISEVKLGFKPKFGEFSLVGHAIRYTPMTDSCRTDIFSYSIKNSANVWSAPAQVVMHCSDVHPRAYHDNARVLVNQSVTFSPLHNDIDPKGLALSVTDITQPNYGSAVLANDGKSIVYHSKSGQCLSGNYFTDTVTYRAKNSDGQLSKQGVITINVACDGKPVARDDVKEYQGGLSSVIDIIANDYDPQGLSLEFVRLVSLPANGRVTMSGSVATYVPDNNQCVDDRFTYEIKNSNNQVTQAQAVVFCGQPPVAANDVAYLYAGGNVKVDVLGNDHDPRGLDLHITNISHSNTFGFPRIVDDGKAIDFVNVINVCDQIASPSFSETIHYNVANSWGQQHTAASVEFVMLCADPVPPVGEADIVSYLPDTPLVIDAIANDTDPMQLSLEFGRVLTAPQHGQLQQYGDTLFYTQVAGSCVDDSFTYQVKNSHGDVSQETPVTIWCGEGPPVAANDEVTIVEGQSKNIHVLANDRDPQSTALSVESISVLPEHGVATIMENNQVITYVSDNSRCATTSFFHDTFRYRAQNALGQLSSETEVRVIVVCESYGLPVANDDHLRFSKNTPLTVDMLANDSDPNDSPMRVKEITFTPRFGTLTPVGNGYTYQPEANYCGDDLIGYRLINSNNIEADAIVYLTCVNPPPKPFTFATQETAFMRGLGINLTWSMAAEYQEQVTYDLVEINEQGQRNTILTGVSDENGIYTPSQVGQVTLELRACLENTTCGETRSLVLDIVEQQAPPKPESFSSYDVNLSLGREAALTWSMPSDYHFAATFEVVELNPLGERSVVHSGFSQTTVNYTPTQLGQKTLELRACIVNSLCSEIVTLTIQVVALQTLINLDFSATTVSVGQSVTVNWDLPENLTCRLKGLSQEFIGKGSLDVVFYSLLTADEKWQCVDSENQLTELPAQLLVAPLGAPELLIIHN